MAYNLIFVGPRGITPREIMKRSRRKRSIKETNRKISGKKLSFCAKVQHAGHLAKAREDWAAARRGEVAIDFVFTEHFYVLVLLVFLFSA